MEGQAPIASALIPAIGSESMQLAGIVRHPSNSERQLSTCPREGGQFLTGVVWYI